MKYEWKQTVFTPEDLNAGDYIVREPHYKLLTPFILYKKNRYEQYR